MVRGLDDWHLMLAPAALRLCPTQGDGVHWSRWVAAGVLGPKEQGTGPGLSPTPTHCHTLPKQWSRALCRGIKLNVCLRAVRANKILAQPCLSFGFARRVVCVCACVCAVSLCTCRAFLLVASRP